MTISIPESQTGLHAHKFVTSSTSGWKALSRALLV